MVLDLSMSKSYLIISVNFEDICVVRFSLTLQLFSIILAQLAAELMS